MPARLTALLLALAVCAAAPADEKPPPIEVGKPAPAFTLPNHLGKPIALASFAKARRWVLIAFYPKVATPG